jgi:N-acetylmuramic acid 6-phosphate (MurNAc-6-P) etherase
MGQSSQELRRPHDDRNATVMKMTCRRKRLGAVTTGFACNANSALGRAADVAIETVAGPEFIAGSTRLKAGTAQKLVLNMISTIVMVRLGKVHGNLMVDLNATNEMLRARSERTVMLATGADAESAARALDESGGWAKAAIMMTVTGLDAETNQALEVGRAVGITDFPESPLAERCDFVLTTQARENRFRSGAMSSRSPSWL